MAGGEGKYDLANNAITQKYTAVQLHLKVISFYLLCFSFSPLFSSHNFLDDKIHIFQDSLGFTHRYEQG